MQPIHERAGREKIGSASSPNGLFAFRLASPFSSNPQINGEVFWRPDVRDKMLRSPRQAHHKGLAEEWVHSTYKTQGLSADSSQAYYFFDNPWAFYALT